VAFMLVHCFWLLEFKFIFEFHLFESFPKCPNLLFPNLSTLPYLAQQQQLSAAAQTAGPASRSSPRSSCRRRGLLGLLAR
jgi:hypothetical protein